MPHRSGYPGTTLKNPRSADFGIRDFVRAGLARVRESEKPLDIHADVPHLRPGSPTREAGLREAEQMLTRRREREKQALAGGPQQEQFALNPLQTNPLRAGRLPEDAERRASLADDPRLGVTGGAAAVRTRLRSVGPINRRPDGRQTADSAVRGVVGRPDPVRREPSQADLLERARRQSEDPLVLPLPPEQEEGPNPLNSLFAIDDEDFDPLTVARQAPQRSDFDPITIPEQEGFDPIEVRPQANLQRRTINTPRLLQIAMSKRRLNRATGRGDRFNVSGQEFRLSDEEEISGGPTAKTGGAALRARNERLASASGSPRSGVSAGQAEQLATPQARQNRRTGAGGISAQAPAARRGRGAFQGANVRTPGRQSISQPASGRISARAEILAKLGSGRAPAPAPQQPDPPSRSARTPTGPAIRSERNRVIDIGERADVVTPPGAGGQRRSAQPSPAAQQRELSLADPVAGRARDRGILASDVLRRAATRREAAGGLELQPETPRRGFSPLAPTPPRATGASTGRSLSPQLRRLALRRPGIRRILGLRGIVSTSGDRSSRGRRRSPELLRLLGRGGVRVTSRGRNRRFEDDTTQHQLTEGVAILFSVPGDAA